MSLEIFKFLVGMGISCFGIVLPCAYIIWAHGRKMDKERKAADAAATSTTWCQFCEDIKPTKDFDLDPIGRWACLMCRKDAGFEAGFEAEESSVPHKATRNYAGRHIDLGDVPARTQVNAQGGCCRVTVAGDVGEYAEIYAYGGSAEIVIHGEVARGARIVAGGSGAKIFIEGYIHSGAIVRASGGSSKVIYRRASPDAKITASGGSSEVRQAMGKVC
jgi:hypothetical protein